MFQEFITNCFLWCFHQFRKTSWELIFSKNEAEEIYRKEDQLLVLIKQEELGKRLYEIVRFLQLSGTKVQAWNKSLQICDCYTDRQKRVKAFGIRLGEIDENGSAFSYREEEQLLKVQKLVDFVESLQKEGYNLKQTDLQLESLESLSSLLASFENGGSEEKNKEILIPYIHTQLSEGKRLEETYQLIEKQNKLVAYTDFPYELPLIKMCYQYFVAGTTPKSISKVIKAERAERQKSWMGENSFWDNSLMVGNRDLSQQFAILQQTSQFILYAGNFKIYSAMPKGFAEFLKNKEIDREERQVVEQISNLLINFEGEVIGYQFTEQRLPESKDILKGFKTSYEVLTFLTKLVYWLSLLKGDLEPSKQQNSSQEQQENPFELKQDVLWSWSYFCGLKFKLTTVQAEFYLINLDIQVLWQQILELFFQWYESLLEEKYGSMQEEEQFFRKVEIRYLNPILAQEFVNFVLKRKVNIPKAIKELFFLLKENRQETEAGDYYDARFLYDPEKVPFLFTYDAKSKYRVSLGKEMNQLLPEGRTLVTFQRKRTIFDIKQRVDKQYKTIRENFKQMEGENIVLAGISEVIYSKEIDAKGRYRVVGYVTAPSKGEVLSMKFLKSLSNRELYQVFAHLFSRFDDKEICWDAIKVDKNFVFTIQLLDPNFGVIRSRARGTGENYVSYICKELEKEGYNPNAFYVESRYGRIFDLRDPHISFFGDTTKNYIESFDAYCEEHGVYFESKEGICPICKQTRELVNPSLLMSRKAFFGEEDGSHYQITATSNLKVCKGTDQWMAKLEANVDRMIAERLQGCEISLEQNGFIPIKKAIDPNKQFIGYTYRRFNFEGQDIVNLRNTKRLGNLARLKGLIRLMLQVKENLQRGLAFLKNPYGEVFIQKDYKHQVQIANIGYLSKEGSKESTKKWTCHYVCKLVKQDENLEAVMPKGYQKMGFEELLHVLTLVEEDLKNHCMIHRLHYSKSKKFCPRCLNEKVLRKLLVKVDPEEITSQTMITQGGESYIYPYGERQVVKVFKKEVISTSGEKQPVDLTLKTIVLARVMGKKVLGQIGDGSQKYHYVSPQKLLADDQGELFAYSMEKVVGGRPISDLRDRSILEEIGFTMEDTLEVLITVGNGIEALHQNGIYIGDLNGRNILFTQEKHVYFLEFDGMGIDEIPAKFCTEGYIDPQSSKANNITMKDDWYSFAIQSFYYLFLTHPFNGVYEEINENGYKVELEIPEKMEKRISLLGNHGMRAPSIARSWEFWMSRELKTAFLNTFEGDLRINIVPYLEAEYQKRTGRTVSQGLQVAPNLQEETSQKVESEERQKAKIDGTLRINSKFIAIQQKPFECKRMIRLINPFSAVILTQEEEEAVAVLVERDGQKKQYHINNHYDNSFFRDIRDVLLLEEDMAIVIGSNSALWYQLSSNTVFHRIEGQGLSNATANKNTVYYTAESKSQSWTTSIYRANLFLRGVVEEEIRFLPQKDTKRFLAKFNSKFVIVKEDENGSDAVYCNKVKFCNVDYDSTDRNYNIIYDEVSKEWLVISSEGNGVIIRADGSKTSIRIPEKIVQEMEVENVSFRKETIYIPGQNCLHIFKVKEGQLTIAKEMECDRIMTPQSKLYNINSQGFSVMNIASQGAENCQELDNTLYEVRRG